MDDPREARYWAKVDRRGDDECWPWTAFRNQYGYGMFRGATEQLAHRYGYQLANHRVPTGMLVCHHCDNPPCQNPRHLYLGTPADNAADREGRNRSALPPALSGEANGRARLAVADVQMIRQLWAIGTTQDSLSKKFGISQTQVSRIVRFHKWKELGMEPVSLWAYPANDTSAARRLGEFANQYDAITARDNAAEELDATDLPHTFVLVTIDATGKPAATSQTVGATNDTKA